MTPADWEGRAVEACRAMLTMRSLSEATAREVDGFFARHPEIGRDVLTSALVASLAIESAEGAE